MSDTVISAENISKRYQIGGKRDPKDGLRHRLEHWLNPAKWGKGNDAEKRGAAQDFWALKDVSFEIKQGEVVGIIGRNGAGKSTLLKVLSRITEPTTGRITLKGRVASLLEVGTGFHPELTGRENIFLNGAILGMSKAEIKRKFDEIVAFSEIEKFLDTPVKRYSSGMYVRLAFAVAAHLEPEILICDEVLAVGDVQFQKKCMGKMQDVSKAGRTVLFVSHNMPAIIQLCSRVVCMSSGKVSFEGGVDEGVSRYFNAEDGVAIWENRGDLEAQRRTRKLFFTRLELLDSDGKATTSLNVRKKFRVKMYYEVPNDLKPVELAVRVLSSDGQPVVTTLLSDSKNQDDNQCKVGAYVAEVEFPELFFMPGRYMMNVASHANVGEIYDLLEGIFKFTIQDTGTRYTKYGHNSQIGVVMRDFPWIDSKLNFHQKGI
jgi:lipopolysaccharide transport system ATP-binding protein